jgi:predicted transcriptional regulator
MTPTQCRMARAALDWSTTDLARAAEVGPATVNRFETGQDARISTVEKLRTALEAAGVVFIAENGGGAGVRFRETKGRKQTEA